VILLLDNFFYLFFFKYLSGKEGVALYSLWHGNYSLSQPVIRRSRVRVIGSLFKLTGITRGLEL